LAYSEWKTCCVNLRTGDSPMSAMPLLTLWADTEGNMTNALRVTVEENRGEVNFELVERLESSVKRGWDVLWPASA
jgi:hypothetical protein